MHAGPRLLLPVVKGIELGVEILKESPECAKVKVSYRFDPGAESQTVLTQTGKNSARWSGEARHEWRLTNHA